MFILQGLEEVKARSVKHLKHQEALPTTTHLNDGRYEIIFLEEICERAFVYKAFDTKEDRFVSIKEYFPRDALGFQEELYFVRDLDNLSIILQDENDYKLRQYRELIDGFIEEASYLEKISYGDPVLRIVDAFEDYNTAYIVSNYNQWPSLQDFLNSDYEFSNDELDWVSNQLIDIVLRFHKRLIVHRNINPKNIYIKPGELVLDSIGACDFLQDIKIYDADNYHSKYYAPEIMMHDGVIGTWTDVYAIGKVIIDMISTRSIKGDYLDGLESLFSKQKEVYKDLIQKSIVFDYKNRLPNAVAMKKELMYESIEAKTFKTPKSMIAAIAMISFISCMLLVLTYNNDTMMAGNYVIIEEEDVPLGSVTIENKACYFVISKLDVAHGTPVILRWFVSGKADISHITLTDTKSNILNVDLEESQSDVDLTEYQLNLGVYQVKLYYKIEDQILLETMELKIIE